MCRLIQPGPRRPRVVLCVVSPLCPPASAAARSVQGRPQRHGPVLKKSSIANHLDRPWPGFKFSVPVLRPVMGAKVELIDQDNKVLGSGRPLGRRANID